MAKGASDLMERRPTGRLPLSHIPVMSPRPSGSLPSSLPSLHLGLVPPSRHPAVGESPSHRQASSNLAHSPKSTNAGHTSFRSFRNLLPFGPGKQHAWGSGSLGTARSSFGGFSVRRSSNGERVVSTPQLRTEKLHHESPVLAIDFSHVVDEPVINHEESRTRLGLHRDSTELTSLPSPVTPSLPVETTESSLPHPVGISDLSTILESETSGISKHIPALDDSEDIHPELEISGVPRKRSIPPSLDLSFLQPCSEHNSYRTDLAFPSQNTSALDLSTSKISTEVQEALSENGRKEEWVNGMVVQDLVDTPSKNISITLPTKIDEGQDVSFNLSALDPDLAALLSPYKPILEPAAHIVPRATRPPPLMPSGSFSQRTSPMHPHHRISPRSPPHTPSTSLPSPALTSRAVSAQSLPVLRMSSLSRSHSPRFSSSSLPRLAHPTSDRISPTSNCNIHSPQSRTATDRRTSAVTLLSTSEKALALPHTMPKLWQDSDVDGHQPRSDPDFGTGDAERRSTSSRFVTPSRHSLHLTPASTGSINGGRPSLRSSYTPASSGAWEASSVSPSSRPPSSLSAALSRRHLYSRTSLDGETVQNVFSTRLSLDDARERLKAVPGRRTRSASVVESHRPLPRSSSQYVAPRMSTECLGPRTTKAFAAAGLLDLDRDGNASPGVTHARSSPRLGSIRSSSDRDFRSRRASSRMAFSEAGSVSSWGRRSESVSRHMAMSEGGGQFNDSVSTPRTTFSTGSTAPTSVSALSAQHHLESELQSLQEKHSLETSALLHALADSQTTACVLREENTDLRDRLQKVEDQLADALEQLRQMRYSRPPVQPSRTLRIDYSNEPDVRSAEDLDGPAHARLHVFHNVEDSPPRKSLSSLYLSADTPRESDILSNSPRRFSSSSSIFPIPPSNMTMLLQEETLLLQGDTMTLDGRRALSTAPSSPTLVVGRALGKPGPGPSHDGHNRNPSISSIGTTDISILTSSPGSLFLRPEHERHLGDMASLDLRAEEFDSETYDSCPGQ